MEKHLKDFPSQFFEHANKLLLSILLLARMEPVLTVFRDHVLFLKHNLNAQAVSSLKGELVSIESNVGRLVRDMESAIKDAQSFIEVMES